MSQRMCVYIKVMVFYVFNIFQKNVLKNNYHVHNISPLT